MVIVRLACVWLFQNMPMKICEVNVFLCEEKMCLLFKRRLSLMCQKMKHREESSFKIVFVFSLSSETEVSVFCWFQIYLPLLFIFHCVHLKSFRSEHRECLGTSRVAQSQVREWHKWPAASSCCPHLNGAAPTFRQLLLSSWSSFRDFRPIFWSIRPGDAPHSSCCCNRDFRFLSSSILRCSAVRHRQSEIRWKTFSSFLDRRPKTRLASSPLPHLWDIGCKESPDLSGSGFLPPRRRRLLLLRCKDFEDTDLTSLRDRPSSSSARTPPLRWWWGIEVRPEVDGRLRWCLSRRRARRRRLRRRRATHVLSWFRRWRRIRRRLAEFRSSLRSTSVDLSTEKSPWRSGLSLSDLSLESLCRFEFLWTNFEELKQTFQSREEPFRYLPRKQWLKKKRKKII